VVIKAQPPPEQVRINWERIAFPKELISPLTVIQRIETKLAKVAWIFDSNGKQFTSTFGEIEKRSDWILCLVAISKFEKSLKRAVCSPKKRKNVVVVSEEEEPPTKKTKQEIQEDKEKEQNIQLQNRLNAAIRAANATATNLTAPQQELLRSQRPVGKR